MSPNDTLIVTAAALDLIFLLVLAVVALKFKALAAAIGGQRRSFQERVRCIAGAGERLGASVRERAEKMRHIATAVGQNVSARVATTRRIVGEVVHPQPVDLEALTRSAATGREWAARLRRLGAAARHAAGEDGRSRHRA